MKFLALGGWFGSGNVGDDAILIGVNDLLHDLDPDTELVALSTNPTKTSETCGVEAVQLLSPKKYLLSRDKYKRTFESVDAVLVTGGTPFYDWDHVSRLLHMWHARSGKPIFCLGVGAKRINSIYGRLLTSMLLKGANRISARDFTSQKRLGELSGREIALTGDSALWMKPNSTKANRAPSGGKWDEIVVIAPRLVDDRYRHHYHDPVPKMLAERMRIGLTRLADGLIDAGYTVVFLPMHDSSVDNDGEEIAAITSRMRKKPTITARALPPRECAVSLGSAKLVVGMRLHALVLAASRGVPVLSVNYDEKIPGFIDYVGAIDCVMPPEGLYDRAFELLEDGDRLGERLRQACDSMKIRIRGEAEAILSAVSG